MLQSFKGAPPSTVRVIRAHDGSGAAIQGQQLFDLIDVNVGSIYKFYLQRETVWFQGSDHYVLLAAETV